MAKLILEGAGVLKVVRHTNLACTTTNQLISPKKRYVDQNCEQVLFPNISLYLAHGSNRMAKLILEGAGVLKVVRHTNLACTTTNQLISPKKRYVDQNCEQVLFPN